MHLPCQSVMHGPRDKPTRRNWLSANGLRNYGCRLNFAPMAAAYL